MRSFVSAVVCTYNRCESLRETLQSLRRQVMPAGRRLELIVIDNNSADQTARVVEEASRVSAWPIRYVAEPRQGIAYARNRGLQSAEGDYVAFIDDDAVASDGWVQALWRCFEETQADLVGGRIDPWWLTARPQWLSDDLMGPIISLDWGPDRKACEPGDAFLTTNCAFRRSSLLRYGVFDTTLGRRGTRWVGGEDFELCHRWRAQGAMLVYEPSAVVRHKVEPERVTPQFYRRWFEDVAYTQGHQTANRWHHRVSVMPLWRWKAFGVRWRAYHQAQCAPDGAARKLQTELWWTYERSFLKERWDHWTGKLRCAFLSAQ